MLMLNQVVDQPFWVGIGFLVRWVGYPSTVGNDGLCVWCNPDELCLRHVLEERWRKAMAIMTIMVVIVVIAAVATVGGTVGLL